MSGITWSGNRLIQRVGQESEELGYVELEGDSGTAVLWLKDTCSVLGLNGGVIRGDAFASMADAKKNAASSPCAFIMHWIWLRAVAKRGTLKVLDEHWNKVSSELDGDLRRKAVREMVAEYLDKLPPKKSGEWYEKIQADPLIVGVLLILIAEALSRI